MSSRLRTKDGDGPSPGGRAVWVGPGLTRNDTEVGGYRVTNSCVRK